MLATQLTFENLGWRESDQLNIQVLMPFGNNLELQLVGFDLCRPAKAFRSNHTGL